MAFNLFKKKGISVNSANFARLVKQYCLDSGIPIPMQIKITKAIAKDFIDDPKRNINDFLAEGLLDLIEDVHSEKVELNETHLF